jgi:excisionase family DNA binding protein
MQPNLEEQHSPSDSRWVTIRKLAAILDLSYPTVRKMVVTGKVEAVVIGGRYRIYEKEVWRLLREGNRRRS